MGRTRPPPHKWGGQGHLPTRCGGNSPPVQAPSAPPAFQATSPHGGRRGRLGQAGGWGSCCWVVGCDAGRGSACLSLGRGTQRAETLATICCVPSQVITPNVVAVKTIE